MCIEERMSSIFESVSSGLTAKRQWASLFAGLLVDVSSVPNSLFSV